MARPRIELADVIRMHGDEFLDLRGSMISAQQKSVLTNITQCRTRALGGHVDACDTCGALEISYNSCRDRHCPKCQGASSAEWFRARAEDLLPVPHFHVVCTLPHELGPLVLTNQKFLYDLLMKTAAAALLKAAALPHPLGARIGFFGVLHTWGQKLGLHPHVHFVVPAGGLSQDQSQWIPGRRNYLVPERVLAKFFRGKFIDGLDKAYRSGTLAFHGPSEHLGKRPAFEKFLRPLRKKKWVVYAKPPFAGSDAVVKYLARYTHRVAISNHRLLRLDESGVTFGYKDYSNGNESRSMTLSGPEFLRRFLLHVVPKGFVRIRYYGFLSNRNRKENLALCRTLIDDAGIAEQVSHVSEVLPDSEAGEESDPTERLCPHCKQGRMIRVETLEVPASVPPRAPP